MLFQNRPEAGQALAEKLGHFKNAKNTIVLGLPRGGVPVAYEIAQRLKLPLDVFIVRKLGVPTYQELAMGALAEGNIILLNEDIMNSCGVSEAALQRVIQIEEQELQRRSLVYRGQRNFPDLTNHTVILVDDGIATGATMRTAIKALKQQQVTHVVAAVPISPASTLKLLKQEADEVICLDTPSNFMSVGQFYAYFPQLTDEEVIDSLK